MNEHRVPRRWSVVFTTPFGVLRTMYERMEYPNIRVAEYNVAYSAAVDVARWVARSMAEGVNEQAQHNLIHTLVDDPKRYTVKELTLRMEWIE